MTSWSVAKTNKLMASQTRTNGSPCLLCVAAFQPEAIIKMSLWPDAMAACAEARFVAHRAPPALNRSFSSVEVLGKPQVVIVGCLRCVAAITRGVFMAAIAACAWFHCRLSMGL
jgi:hypothetical protein